MSLATTGGGLGGMGGGGGAGAMAMASHVNAVARPTQPNAPPQPDIPMGSAPPISSAALGADLVDKQQSISLKQVRDSSHMPLVAIDLYANQPHVAMFPPKNKDEAATQSPSLVGKMKARVAFQSTEVAHKKLRKWLSKSKGYSSLQPDALAKADDTNSVVFENPQQWLGMRRLSDAPDHLRKSVVEEEPDTPAIAEEASQSPAVIMANGTLDGSVAQGDDFDRVLCKLRLHESKKALTLLPEEAVQLVLNQAQYHVARKVKADVEEEEIVDYPCCVAVPGVYSNDASIEALLDACGGSGVFFPRSICALAGALMPGQEGKPNTLLSHINKVQQAMHKEFQKKQAKNPDARFEEDMMVLLAGVTGDVAECTAVQISGTQQVNCCFFGHYKVVSNVAYQATDPHAAIEKCLSEIFENVDAIAPEADGPIGLVTYGSSEEQKLIQAKWDKLKKTLEDWEEVSHFHTKPECVAMGTAVLGAVSHGRLSKVVQIPGKKPKAQLAIQIQNVASVAVGVRFNYHGGDKRKWEAVKTIFDFDRRVPAGPYQLDLNAAECAVNRGGAKDLSEEELLKAIKEYEGSKFIPNREEAALNLRVQVVQKYQRDGEWRNIGDPMSPLVVVDADDVKTACEKVVLELSLGATGLISNALVGERESVVQATKSARNSALRWYLGVFFAVAFFGGFLIKSYWEEAVFERDTKRLLAYYKHVIPGSMQDGDLHNARYLVWKYRGKKEKLWKSLEKKYGEPVLHEHEWKDSVEEEGGNEEEHEDLDKEANDEGSGGDQEL